jgi:hypothetical protein
MSPGKESVSAASPAGWRTIEELSDYHLGGRPSATALESLRQLERGSAEVRDFTERAFKLMGQWRFDPKDISPTIARVHGALLPGILPEAWGGIVPPISWQGRHQKIDTYLRSNPWAALAPGTVFMDVGCGFPPLTAVDAAGAFPDWQVIGADPVFDQYLLQTAEGAYACLDMDGRVRYFQGNPATAGVGIMHTDRAAMVRGFQQDFAALVAELPGDDGRLSTIERHGRRLIRHPLQMYERPNLKLIRAGYGSPDVPRADIVRSFNVLLYFDAEFRRTALDWVMQVLRPGGMFICGFDTLATLEARYTVYRKESGGLVEKEFAFALETLHPIGWFTIQNDEREMQQLAKFAGIVRSDGKFLCDYNARLDALFAERRIAVRDQQGYLVSPADPIDPTQEVQARLAIAQEMEAEFADRAVSVLCAAGFNSWRNSAGHIAVASESE